MKKLLYGACCIAMLGLLGACKDHDHKSNPIDTGGGSDSGSESSTGTSIDILGDLTTFNIATDTSDLEETETIDAEDEDYIENNTFGTDIKIIYDGDTATTEGEASGVDIEITGADVVVTSTVKGIRYIVSGQSDDGMLKVYSDKKYALTLDGVSLKNADGPAVNLQSGKRAYVVLADGTTSTLTDGTAYADSDEDQKGTFFAEGKILLSGTGTLNVNANTKHGIASDDYVLVRPGVKLNIVNTASAGIKAKDALYIKGGVVNITVSGTAAKAISCDADVEISGGRLTLITSGGGIYDTDDAETKGASGIKADGNLTITGGEINCKSTGSGGKGISVDGDMEVGGGSINVITTGTTYTYGSDDTKAKGIKADGNLTITGGTLRVRATGDDGSEGIESKSEMRISGGEIEAYSVDDAINSSSHLYIEGGKIFAYSTGNDGIDSNGNLYIAGGTTVAYGTTSPECGIDANDEEGYSVIVTGGVLVGIGGGTSYPSSASTQPSVVYGGTANVGTTLALKNSADEALIGLNVGRAYGGTACYLMTATGLTASSDYVIASGGTLGGEHWHGLYVAPELTGEWAEAEVVSGLSSPYSKVGDSIGGGGGNGGNGGFGGNTSPGGGNGGGFGANRR